MPAPYIEATTQDHLDIEDVVDNLIVLKNGNVAAVLKTTAVNFELLSEIEQDALIASFSMLLNSISYPIQIMIRSKRVDISGYLAKVIQTENRLTDPLLKKQAQSYRKFIRETIKVNEVLDKKFYVVVPAGNTIQTTPSSGPFDFIPQMLGMKTRRTHVNVQQVLAKTKPEINPKIEHLVGEFNRLGIKTTQLATQEIVSLLFEMYNPDSVQGQRIRTNINDYKTAIVEPAILEE